MGKLFYLYSHEGVLADLWDVDESKARCVYPPFNTVPLKEGESLLDALGHRSLGEPGVPVWTKECARKIGEYYRRIYRPSLDDRFPGPPQEMQHVAESLGQLATLTEQLARIFRVIFPADNNLKTYGYEIRNLILLACTEVEAQWKGILKANNASPAGPYFNTKDYVKLLKPLKLAEYQVILPIYPQLPSLSPFAVWNSEKPSKSLLWYDAYNAVKHDRETQFHQATLKYAIHAVVACAVMLGAQYGLIPAWHDQLGQFFRFEKRPQWSHQERYLPPPIKTIGGWSELPSDRLDFPTEWYPTGFPF